MYRVLNNIQLTKNFKMSEVVCHDGSNEVMVNMVSLNLLQKLRDSLGKPIVIAAGYRNAKHNAAVGGSPNSRHMLGDAWDIKPPRGLSAKDVAVAARAVGFTGIGVYTNNGQNFVHLDHRANITLWKDNKGTKNLTPLKSLNQLPD